MAVTGTLRFGGELSGEPEGSSTLSLSWTVTDGVSDALVLTTETGAVTVTVPQGTSAADRIVVIIPPTSNTQTLTVKGVSGDTGFQISKTRPTVFAWQTGTSFVLTLGGAVAGLKILFV